MLLLIIGGISASTTLSELFAHAVARADKRIIKVAIQNESLVPVHSVNVKGTWEEDFVNVVPLLERDHPCYLLYRLDSKNPSNDYDWTFLVYVPDHAKVREKMLYSSTRATLKRDLGAQRFVDECYGTNTWDFSLDGYHKHRGSKAAAAPLTEREEEIARIRKEETGADIGVTTKKAHVHGVAFPPTATCVRDLEKLRDGSIDFVMIHLDNESLDVTTSAGTLPGSQLASELSGNNRFSPRFVLYAYRHMHDSRQLRSVVFIYSCPNESKVKERMMYSSAKAGIVSMIEQVGIVVEKKIETSDPSELTESMLLEEIHPKKVESKAAFKRPMRPGAGKARLAPSNPSTPEN